MAFIVTTLISSALVTQMKTGSKCGGGGGGGGHVHVGDCVLGACRGLVGTGGM